ncbi:hypothetical protein PRIPAC_71635 [Pristionchus pacificus]|uniref:Uncharacterized protein n=1 Tax=Pristionchus pacificus TaxID=54126 RepID=A0A454XRZ8_PRIPA|nr:hypothetical protein PRIPAC_71635 [Pristionchus pacificus]|eukprot:PDM71946.1 hypothetical protein PRIPAC_38353 [Pristionchus pacificus]
MRRVVLRLCTGYRANGAKCERGYAMSYKALLLPTQQQEVCTISKGIDMRPLSILLLLFITLSSVAAFRPRYWRLNRYGRWKTSAWGSSEEAGYQAGFQASGMRNVGPSYYAQYPTPGGYGYGNVYGGPVAGKK